MNHEKIKNDLKNYTFTTWDFNIALGDTIMEKFESLYVKLVESMELLNSKTDIWIVGSQGVVDIFNCASVGFEITPGLKSPMYQGTFHQWKIYLDKDLKNTVIVGSENSDKVVRIEILNFE